MRSNPQRRCRKARLNPERKQVGKSTRDKRKKIRDFNLPQFTFIHNFYAKIKDAKKHL
jgi:hypothetical protein